MKTSKIDKMTLPDHVTSEQIISYLDGELDRDSQDEMRIHLESCWNCRKNQGAIERSIENFLQLRHDSLLPREIPPSGPALDLFRERLSAHAETSGVHSYFSAKMPDIRRFFTRVIQPLKFESYAPGAPRLIMRVATAFVMVSVVAVFVLMSGRFTSVSARELLDRSINAENAQIASASQPVVHQKIQVKRIGATSDDDPETWEIWNDTENKRIQQASFNLDQTGREHASSAAIDLQRIFQMNHMDAGRPLSAASYRSWSDTVKSKTEEVFHSTNVNGSELLIIHTTAAEPLGIGDIADARFTVRAGDYHPTGLYLRVKTVDGEQVYELIENNFEVVSLANLDPSIFAEVPVIPADSMAAKVAKPSPSVEVSPSPEENETKEPATAVTQLNVPAATMEAEVDVLDLLHKAGADVGEQMNVTRTVDGHLLVEGLVESDKRKQEILGALSPVASNPAIKIQVQTIDEATRVLAKQKQTAEPGSESRVEVNKGPLAAESDLREYFSRNGGDIDAQIHRFSSSAINRSQNALFQASALNRLANRFTPAQMKSLEPGARAKWLSIVKGYAAAVRNQTAGLRQELQPVFFAGMSDGGENEAAVTTDADLARAVKRLYDLAAANDRIVRNAFTLSTGNASFSIVKTPQFRRNLASAEKLAAAVERAH